VHPDTIALGLERTSAVFRALDLRVDIPVVTVAGTNGKGSTCAFLEAILQAAGYRVGLYTSPHLLRYNERVRVDGQDISDEALCVAFEAAETARLSAADALGTAVPLTYFEFGTLAALWHFAQCRVDVMVLEVGLGGRLDAVNCVDPDVAVVTTIDIDHVNYLGSTREAIGREKSGIFRPGRPAICGDPSPPASLLDAATRLRATLRRIGIDYTAQPARKGRWVYRSANGRRLELPEPALRGPRQRSNAATAMAALEALDGRVAIESNDVDQAMRMVKLAGRFQTVRETPPTIVDVAHNPQAARVLAEMLSGPPGYHQTLAIFGCMSDKDIDGIIDAMRDSIAQWLVVGLPGTRAATVQTIRQKLANAGVVGALDFPDVRQAYASALDRCERADRIVVFGSFLTFAAMLELCNESAQGFRAIPGSFAPAESVSSAI